MLNEYTITIRAEKPPFLLVDDELCGGRVVSIASNLPEFVSSKWLADRLGLSSQTIRNKLETINMGTEGKAKYPRDMAIKMLEQKKRGAKRKN